MRFAQGGGCAARARACMGEGERADLEADVAGVLAAADGLRVDEAVVVQARQRGEGGVGRAGDSREIRHAEMEEHDLHTHMEARMNANERAGIRGVTRTKLNRRG